MMTVFDYQQLKSCTVCPSFPPSHEGTRLADLTEMNCAFNHATVTLDNNETEYVTESVQVDFFTPY